MDKIEVSKINIRIKDFDIELSLKEADQLRQVLNDLFGNKHEVIRIKEYLPYYPPIYIQPVWIKDQNKYDDWQITYSSDQSNSAGVLNMALGN